MCIFTDKCFFEYSNNMRERKGATFVAPFYLNQANEKICSYRGRWVRTADGQ